MAVTTYPTTATDPQKPIQIQQTFRYLLVIQGPSDVDVILIANNIRESINLRNCKAYDFGQPVKGATLSFSSTSTQGALIIQTSNTPIPNIPSPQAQSPSGSMLAFGNDAKSGSSNPLITGLIARYTQYAGLTSFIVKQVMLQNQGAIVVRVSDSAVAAGAGWALKADSAGGGTPAGDGGTITILNCDLANVYIESAGVDNPFVEAVVNV